MEPWPETPLVETMDSLYLADAPQLLKALQEVPETVRSVMVVGHNPGCTSWRCGWSARMR